MPLLTVDVVSRPSGVTESLEALFLGALLISSGVQSFVGGVVMLGSDGGAGFDVCCVGERGRVFLGMKPSASFVPSGLSLNTVMVSHAFWDPVVIGRAVVSRVCSVGRFLTSRALIDSGR